MPGAHGPCTSARLLPQCLKRLQTSSPCINAGNNSCSSSGATDLDGNPRIIGSRVDIGAYELQSPGRVSFQVWLQFYGLPTNGSADYTDADADGHNNWQEWRCQTDPTSVLSSLRLLSAAPVVNHVALTWQSVPGVNYVLESSTGSLAAPFFTTVATNITAKGATTIYTNTNAATSQRLFYRVGVGN